MLHLLFKIIFPIFQRKIVRSKYYSYNMKDSGKNVVKYAYNKCYVVSNLYLFSQIDSIDYKTNTISNIFKSETNYINRKAYLQIDHFTELYNTLRDKMLIHEPYNRSNHWLYDEGAGGNAITLHKYLYDNILDKSQHEYFVGKFRQTNKKYIHLIKFDGYVSPNIKIAGIKYKAIALLVIVIMNGFNHVISYLNIKDIWYAFEENRKNEAMEISRSQIMYILKLSHPRIILYQRVD